MKPRGEFCYTVRNMRLEEGNWLKTSQRSKNEFSFSTPAGGGKAPITVWHPPENRKMRGKETSGCIGEEFLSVSSKGKRRANFNRSSVNLGFRSWGGLLLLSAVLPLLTADDVKLMCRRSRQTGKQNSGNFPSLNAGFFIPPDSLQECRSREGKTRFWV